MKKILLLIMLLALAIPGSAQKRGDIPDVTLKDMKEYILEVFSYPQCYTIKQCTLDSTTGRRIKTIMFTFPSGSLLGKVSITSKNSNSKKLGHMKIDCKDATHYYLKTPKIRRVLGRTLVKKLNLLLVRQNITI